MIKTWRVRLELARDDDGPLSDEGVEALTHLLADDDLRPVVTRGEMGAVVVQMTLDSRDDQAVRSVAEHMLHDHASTVWSTLGLPPFTITFVDATEGAS
jgi:hypothetical protein